jgi:hypothetical protein
MSDTTTPIEPVSIEEVFEALEEAWHAITNARSLAKRCPRVSGVARADLDAAQAAIDCALVYPEDPERPTHPLPTTQGEPR